MKYILCMINFLVHLRKNKNFQLSNRTAMPNHLATSVYNRIRIFNNSHLFLVKIFISKKNSRFKNAGKIFSIIIFFRHPSVLNCFSEFLVISFKKKMTYYIKYSISIAWQLFRILQENLEFNIQESSKKFKKFSSCVFEFV